MAAGIKHEIKKADKWHEGPNQGIIVTFGDEITSELETVNSKGNCLELVSEERLSMPLRKTCFSLVFTRYAFKKTSFQK